MKELPVADAYRPAARVTPATDFFSCLFEANPCTRSNLHPLPRDQDRRRARTPPSNNMAQNGLLLNAKPYRLVIDTRVESSAKTMMQDLASGAIDAGVLWGPMAGYYAKIANQPITVVPLVKETSGPRLVYRITMGVRTADQEWKRLLNRLIQENQAEINAILLSYGVPLLDEQDRPITATSPLTK